MCIFGVLEVGHSGVFLPKYAHGSGTQKWQMIQTTFWVLRRIDTEDWMALTIEYTANFALWTCSSLLIYNRLSSHWLREPLITTQPCFPRPNYCCLQLSVIWPASPRWASQLATRNFILVSSKIALQRCFEDPAQITETGVVVYFCPLLYQ